MVTNRRPTSFKDPEEVQRKVDEYFAQCEASKTVYELKNGDVKIRQQFPTMAGLAVFLNVDRDTLKSYINMEEKRTLSADALKAISATLTDARERIKLTLMQASLSGDADSRIAGMLLTAMGETTPEVQNTVNVIIQGDSDAYSV